MTKSGIPATISKMQRSQNNSSTNRTPASPLTIKIQEQEDGETRVSTSLTPPLAPQPRPPRMTTPRPPTPKTLQEGWDARIGLPMSAPYRSPYEWEEAERKERARQEHDQLSWTACYDKGCKTHFRDQEATGWFRQDLSRSGPSVPVWHRNKKQQRKRHGQSLTWYKCFDNKCFDHVQDQINVGYYPEENGGRKTLLGWNRKHLEPEQ